MIRQYKLGMTQQDHYSLLMVADFGFLPIQKAEETDFQVHYLGPKKVAYVSWLIPHLSTKDKTIQMDRDDYFYQARIVHCILCITLWENVTKEDFLMSITILALLKKDRKENREKENQ